MEYMINQSPTIKNGKKWVKYTGTVYTLSQADLEMVEHPGTVTKIVSINIHAEGKFICIFCATVAFINWYRV